MAYEQIEYEERGDIALITLNRPERLNAWTGRMGREMSDAFIRANETPHVGAIVVTGNGRGFCAGADIGDGFKRDLERSEQAEREGKKADPEPTADVGDWVTLCRASKPMLAAINGPAIGVGLTMILPFDYLVASDQARLSCRFVKMGITPELASSHFLISRTGWGAASDLALTGRIVDADEALAMRLVDAVVPHNELLARTLEKAGQFSENPDPQLRMIKELLTDNAVETNLETVQQRELKALKTAMATTQHREAVDAFLEKRPPQFR